MHFTFDLQFQLFNYKSNQIIAEDNILIEFDFQIKTEFAICYSIKKIYYRVNNVNSLKSNSELLIMYEYLSSNFLSKSICIASIDFDVTRIMAGVHILYYLRSKIIY